MKNIQDIITPVKMQLVIFSGANHRRLSLQDIVKRFEKSIDITEIPKSQESGELYKRFGVNEFGYLLIRPDMYIAYRSNTHDPDHFQQYLARFFVPNPLNKTTATT